MRTINILVMLLLCLNFAKIAEAQVLDKKVSLQYKNVTIEEVLKDISKKYNVNFSYSNTIIPLGKKITLTVNGKSLSYALKMVFKDTEVSYEALGSQIVLKKIVKKTPKQEDKTQHTVTEKEQEVIRQNSNADSVNMVKENEKEEFQNQGADKIFAAKDTVVYFEEPSYENLKVSDSLDRKALRKQYRDEKRKLKHQYQSKVDSIDRSGDQSTKANLEKQFNAVSKKLKNKINSLKDSLGNINFHKRDTVAQKDTIQYKNGAEKKSDTSKYVHRPAQVTFVPPIGTNGHYGGQVVNTISLNVLTGYAAGLEGGEIGGLVNIEKDYVKGVQIAGIGNNVGNDVTGAQFSGIYNINGGYTRAAQFSGFMNIVKDSVVAYQAAGFMNVVSENYEGAQTAGFTNIVRGNMEGAQVAGFLNLAGKNMVGAQVAGGINLADTISGVQLAGFMNVAGKVKGSQIGFINVADTVTGVQLGLVSVGGYTRFEIYGSESLYGNVAFKTGSHHLYNIFALGVQSIGSTFRWGVGYGLGTELKVSRKLILNLDLLAYNIHQNGFQFDELNLLNQFRPTFGYLMGRRTSVFVGPVFNVMVSNHYNSETGRYGSPVSPSWNFYDVTEDNINVTMWVGFNAGIRF